MKNIFVFLFALSVSNFANAHFWSDFNTKNPKIQVSLLLDTSNSMDGLIDQAKSQLWKMVNELAASKKNNATPDIEIALYEYGNSNLALNEGYIRQVVPLTSDLDLVSEKLFQLTTNGGSEYCGWVIEDATLGLQWSNNNDDLKIIFIAGNEPFSQGPRDFRNACKAALNKGIIINTIHCGGWQEGIDQLWKEGADIAKGKYMNIDQDVKVVHIPTPYDNDIIKLNKRLNKTYIGYGNEGKMKAERQMVQDSNAAAYGAANARTRASFKAKQSYNNAEWDLVDAAEAEVEILETISKDDLPEEMQNMTEKERKEYIEKKSQERKEIQEQIRQLDEKAKAYVASQQKENAEKLTLDNVMLEAVREQAVQKSFLFEN